MASASSPLPTSPQPKSGTDWQLFLRLWPYIKRQRHLLGVPFALLLPLAIANALQPVLIGQAISLIRQEPTVWFLEGRSLQTGLNLVIAMLMVTVVVRLLLDGVQSYLVQRVGQYITADIRQDLFDHVTALAVRFFDRTPVGKLITRLTSDVEALGDVFSTGAIGIISDIISMVVLIMAMVLLQWQLALMLLAMLLPVTWLIIYFQQQFRKANYKAREQLSELNASLQENIAGINVVQLFRREQFNSHMFRKTNRRYIHAIDKTIYYDSAVSATLEWISLVAIGGVLMLGGLLVLQDSLPFGTLASFILFSQRLFDPLRQFADKFTAIQAGFTAIERIQDLFAESIEIRDPEKHTASNALAATAAIAANNQAAGEIRFEQVSFGYKADDYILKNLDFTIQPGEKVALVGPTGAGKSSIIRLLCRLYEVNQGSIKLDGSDIRDLPQKALRQYMGVILQEGFLFAGDIKDNIALGEPYSLAQVTDAAERTNIAPFIEQLPQGYETVLRERGTNLSGGQKQLLAFARAAIRNPKILVLDEATANLDVATEALIQEALERLLEGRTAIIIAHRLSTIRNVDRILVLRQGELVEQGNHEQLLAQEGLYASLYRLQMLET